MQNVLSRFHWAIDVANGHNEMVDIGFSTLFHSIFWKKRKKLRAIKPMYTHHQWTDNESMCRSENHLRLRRHITIRENDRRRGDHHNILSAINTQCVYARSISIPAKAECLCVCAAAAQLWMTKRDFYYQRIWLVRFYFPIFYSTFVDSKRCSLATGLKTNNNDIKPHKTCQWFSLN